MKLFELFIIVALVAVVTALFAWAIAKHKNADKPAPKPAIGNINRRFHRAHTAHGRRMKAICDPLFRLVARLWSFIDRLCLQLRYGGQAHALTNALGLINESGIESLLLDTASAYGGGAWPGRYYLVQRGATGYQYGDLATGGSNLAASPIGVTPDAPYSTGDVMAVRRLGSRPGYEIGIAAGAVAIDHLLVSTAGGKVTDVATVANGTYWVVGRAASIVAASSSSMEVAYVPDVPYLITVTGGTLTNPTNPL